MYRRGVSQVATCHIRAVLVPGLPWYFPIPYDWGVIRGYMQVTNFLMLIVMIKYGSRWSFTKRIGLWLGLGLEVRLQMCFWPRF